MDAEKKIKILYVDDEELNLQLFKHNFSDKYEVLTCCCGLNGMECLEKHEDIKVIISDMKMPRMTGLEFITKAKAIYSDKVYYILTGFDITLEIKEALKSKLIVKYFKKPFDIEEIEKSINEVL